VSTTAATMPRKPKAQPKPDTDTVRIDADLKRRAETLASHFHFKTVGDYLAAVLDPIFGDAEMVMAAELTERNAGRKPKSKGDK
jgi:hypothetical protein